MYNSAIIDSNEHHEIIRSISDHNHFVNLDRPAVKKDGIRKFNNFQKERFLKIFRKESRNNSFCNFIPASGAGTRMFKDLIAFAQDFRPQLESFSHYVNKSEAYDIKLFFDNIKSLALYQVCKSTIDSINTSNISLDEKRLAIAKHLFLEKRIQDKPKGIQPFHQRDKKVFTAAEEQLILHNLLAKSFYSNTLNFTVKKEFLPAFNKLLIQHQSQYKNVTYSIQDQKNDVLCIDEYRQIALNADGSSMKRPSGHGALLENLNAINKDIIYIHNIDNVPCGHIHNKIVRNRKIITGYLFYVQKQLFKYLELLENGALDNKQTKNLSKFLKRYFHLSLDNVLKSSEQGFYSTIYSFLNRPLRVCGMIPNQNQKGGGPYWVKQPNGDSTLRIVEQIEINPNQTNNINGTHFNPVEIACGVKNYKGKKFDLNLYSDYEAKMLVEKKVDGKSIKFLENPGLWNGSMENWLTMFVEIPSNTFNPVKTITDLLSCNHSEKITKNNLFKRFKSS